MIIERKGFFEHDQFLALRDHLPEYLRGFVTFAYKTGWRVSEISELTWPQVDREQGIVRIEAGETKNDEARTVYMDEELKEIIKQQWETRKTRCSSFFRHSRENGNPGVASSFLDSGSPLRCARNDGHIKLFGEKKLEHRVRRPKSCCHVFF